MPTPVSVARQCLTPEAVHALDEAVAVARRRGHGQTTSLHAVSALLSFPSSILREACARARNCAYSPRLQFKALELCLSVSLDRVSSSQLSDDPPVSNSLMAAIKRSQANQRRQPENFHLYHQISQSHNSSATVIKVELQQLILSILDDPVVSRVFSEAGFRSSEIKLAIVRPLAAQLIKFPRSKVPPPIFLGNHLTDNPDPGSGRRGLSFNFSGFGGFIEGGGDDNCRRIGDVIVKRKNPLLVGVYASGALQSFHQSIERKFTNNNNSNTNHNVLPVELSGLNIISIENDISRFITENSDEGSVDMKFEELSLLMEQQSLGGAAGVVVNFGDLKVFVNDNNNSNNNKNNNEVVDDGTRSTVISHVVAHLSRLLQIHSVKVWLIGCAANQQTYLKLVNRFPSIEKDWNLHLLPIASLRPSSSMAETYPKSSLMESFVPFAGFFSTPSEFKSPLSSLYQCANRCHQCTEKCEQETIALSKGAFSTSIADQYQSSLPSWMQMTEIGTNTGLDGKTKDDGMVLSAKITGLQKKWDDMCRRHHHTQQFPSSNIYQMGSQFPTVMGFPFLKDKKETDDSTSRNVNARFVENSCANVNLVITIDSENMAASKSLSFPIVSKSKNESLPSKPWEKQSKADLELGGLRSPCSLSSSSVSDGNGTSPTSVTSVTTDLGLGMCSAPTINEMQNHTDQDHTEPSPELSGCFSAKVDFVQGSISNYPAQSSTSSCPDLHRQFDLDNCKVLFRALNERVGWQDEAICVICQRVAQSRMGYENRLGKSLRRDIWFNFTGPDRCSKKKIAVALAEMIYGSKENCICADLSFQDGVIDAYTIFDRQDVNGYITKFRGKTLVDYITAELCKKPLSVVFLENVDKADVQAQNILSKAIRTGKFSDSHGREVSIKDAIFVTTTSMKDSKILTSRKETHNYSEERILRAKSWLMQIHVDPAFGCGRVGQTLTTSVTRKGAVFVNKRKLIGMNENQQHLDISEMVKRAHKSSTRNLDLNLPAEEDDQVLDSDDGNSENDSSENSKSWLQDFLDQIETVVFKPFNFDALAEKVLSDINESFHNIVGSECLLQIESKVMEQLLAAAYMSDSNRIVKDWVDKVLNRAFAEEKKRYSLITDSIVKLVTYEGRVLEEPIPGVCLPSKIILK